MSERSNTFEQWLMENYKLSTANRIYQTVLYADAFLRETGGRKAALLEKQPIIACQLLDALRQNKVFKFKYKSTAAALPEAIRAVKQYASEHSETALCTGIQNKTLNENGVQSEQLCAAYDKKDSVEEITMTIEEKSHRVEQPVFRGVSEDSESSIDTSVVQNSLPEPPKEENVSEAIRQQLKKLWESAPREEMEASWTTDGMKFQIDNSLDNTYKDLPQGINISHMKTADIMKHIFEYCIVKLGGMTISQGEIQKNYTSFLAQTAEKSKHNVGIVLHSGSIIFEALAVLHTAISNLIRNETSPEEIVRSLTPGDLVLFHDKMTTPRMRFERLAFDDGREYAVLLQEKSLSAVGKLRETKWVLRKDWGKIEPYNGNSQRLDGRGIKKHSNVRKEFFRTILNVDEKDIPSITDTSTVVVMSRNRADYLAEHLTLCFANREIRLLDLVTASYFTENSEYYYSGNTGKNDPVLKFVSKVSVARQKVLQKNGNRNIGLLVFGDDVIGRSRLELPELMNRKSLQYIFLFSSIDSESLASFVEEVEEAELFALTKEALDKCARKDCFNTYTREMYQQIYALRNCSRRAETISGPWSWEQRRQLTKSIHMVKESAFESREKEDFIMYSWSLMRLFETACFTLQKMDEMASRDMLPVLGVCERLKLLKGLIGDFSSDITSAAENIWSLLELGYQTLLISNPKEERLKHLLNQNRNKKICIVVPKAYYTAIIQRSKLANLLTNPQSLTVVTANRFDRTAVYDKIIVTGDFSSTRFDALTCYSAIDIITLLYPSEQSFWQKRLIRNRQTQRMYNSRSTLMDESLRETWKQENDEAYIEEKLVSYEKETQEIDQFLVQLNERVMWGQFSSASASRNSMEADITAVVTFDTGERAFLTPNYKAYVIKPDAASAEVVERKPADLAEGDSIIFTKNDDATHDLVDDVFQQLLQGDALPQYARENHNMSRRWKDVLQRYMEQHHFKPRQLAKAMKKAGVPVEEQTIANWLDPYVRTICPRDLESLRQIGQFTGDVELVEKPENIYNAGREVKRIRKMILKKIGQMIVDKMSGKEKPEDGSVWNSVYDRIDSMADVMLVESVVPVERKIPANYTNRPISREE